MDCQKARQIVKTFNKIEGIKMTDEQAAAWYYVCHHKNKCKFCQKTYELAIKMEKEMIKKSRGG